MNEIHVTGVVRDERVDNSLDLLVIGARVFKPIEDGRLEEIGWVDIDNNAYYNPVDIEGDVKNRTPLKIGRVDDSKPYYLEGKVIFV